MSQTPLAPGERIGRYTLRHPLGEGGMGVVYAAHDDALDRQVAIKMLHESGTSEYRRGIVHRDLKPSNVFLTAHGAKLLDFGLARALAPVGGITDPTLTAVGSIVGTPRYMAPERWTGGVVSPATDLFAAGAVLFEMLAGWPAFDGTGAIQIYHAVMHEQPPALMGDAGVAAVDRVIRRALEKRPEDRFPGAEAMAVELRDAQTRVTGDSSPRVRTLMRLIVLPFRVLRSDPETDFLAFSLPDAITMSLTGLESLVTRSSASAARFAGEHPDLKAIAKEAEVNAVLTGTLLRAGDQVRVAAQLVNVPSGTVVSSKTAQVALRDIFQLQDGLTREIVTALTVPLSAHDNSMLRRDVPASARAYEFYLRANELARDSRSLSWAGEMYKSCLAEDPNYAPAWARLGRIYRVQAKYGLVGADTEAIAKLAEEAFRKALELSPDLPLAHNLYTPFEIEELGRADEAMTRLIERARSRTADPELYCGLVMACRYAGLLGPSLAADERARRLDPGIPTSVAYTYWMMGDYEKILARQDGDLYVSAYALSISGRDAEAIAQCRDLESRITDGVASAAIGGLRAAIEGDAATCVVKYEILGRSRFRDPEGILFAARSFARVGERARALETLRRVVNMGYACALALRTDSWLDSIRVEPEFGRLIAGAEERRRRGAEAYARAGGEAVLGVGAE